MTLAFTLVLQLLREACKKPSTLVLVNVRVRNSQAHNEEDDVCQVAFMSRPQSWRWGDQKLQLGVLLHVCCKAQPRLCCQISFGRSTCRTNRPWSMPNMIWRPGSRIMEMNGGSSPSCLACTPCVSCFVLCFIGMKTEGLLDYQERVGIMWIMSIVRWKLRLVIAGVDMSKFQEALKRDILRGTSENGIAHWNPHSICGFFHASIRTQHDNSHCSFWGNSTGKAPSTHGKRRLDRESAV